MLKERCDRSKYSPSSNKIALKIINTKGQITIFIILGILILLAVGLVLILRAEVTVTRPEEVIPLETVGVQSLVTACLNNLGLEALNRLGLQGGYVNVPEDISNDGSLHLRLSPMNVVPYWAYGQNTNLRLLPQMEEEINIYIEQNLRGCVLEVESFNQAYNFVEKSEIDSKTEITEGGVSFAVHWELQIREKSGEVVADLTDHSAQSAVKLKSLQETAVKIIEREIRDLKLEDLTQDLIALEHPKVPVSGFELSCTKKKWNVNEVKQTLKDLLRVNMAELKIAGTSFIEFPDDLPYYQNHYVWTIEDDFIQEEVSVLFDFQDHYPFQFEVNPRSGSYLYSSQMGGGIEDLPFLCLQNWKFVYNLNFPVLIRLTDETTGYDFNIAATVHLRNNIPDRSELYVSRPSFLLNPYSDEEYCAQSRIPMTVYTYELIENKGTGVYTREPLADAAITMSCLNYKCEFPETKYNFGGLGDVAAVTANFPNCAGGIFRAEKLGYKSIWQRVVTNPGKEIELNLVPLYYFPLSKIKIVKQELETLGTGLSEESLEELSAEEIAVVRLKFGEIDPLTGEQFQETQFIYWPSAEEEVISEQQIELLAGADFNYDLEIDLIAGDKYVGGYHGQWNVVWDELRNAQEIVFTVISSDSASEEQTYNLIQGLEENSKKIPPPKIKIS
ncbi:MAG TPA: hypothetical protein VJC39_04755 [Candidatus Nanoarchaeia archaeon]|nr:hypothetical protein [Candidatus Nanoarchaeia archaeon]